MVNFLAKHDAVLSKHLTKIKAGQKNAIQYLSPLTQNEFIDIIGCHVGKKIIDRVREAKDFTLIADGTPDSSHRDQTGRVLRYVVVDQQEVEVMESSIDFIET